MRASGAAAQAPPKARAPRVEVASATRGASSSGFWTFVTATILVMFIVYLATKPGDRLTYWIKLFSWESPLKKLFKIPGEHVSGEVNSDAPAGKQYEGQKEGGDVNKEEDSLGPIYGGILRWWKGKK
jgi:hypothetical protein